MSTLFKQFSISIRGARYIAHLSEACEPALTFFPPLSLKVIVKILVVIFSELDDA